MLKAEKLLAAWAWACAVGLVGVLALTAGFLLWRGLPGLDRALFFGDTPAWDAVLYGAPVFDGIWPACLGTLMLVALACGLAIPLGLASGIYLAEYAQGRRRELIALCVELLAGVPSIVMGLFGFALILMLRRSVAPMSPASAMRTRPARTSSVGPAARISIPAQCGALPTNALAQRASRLSRQPETVMPIWR